MYIYRAHAATGGRDSDIAPTRVGASVRLETAPTYQTLENTQFLAACSICTSIGRDAATGGRDSEIGPTRVGASVRLETAPTYQTVENTQFLAA